MMIFYLVLEALHFIYMAFWAFWSQRCPSSAGAIALPTREMGNPREGARSLLMGMKTLHGA
jgi:hypothetical protein